MKPRFWLVSLLALVSTNPVWGQYGGAAPYQQTDTLAPQAQQNPGAPTVSGSRYQERAPRYQDAPSRYQSTPQTKNAPRYPSGLVNGGRGAQTPLGPATGQVGQPRTLDGGGPDQQTTSGGTGRVYNDRSVRVANRFSDEGAVLGGPQPEPSGLSRPQSGISAPGGVGSQGGVGSAGNRTTGGDLSNEGDGFAPRRSFTPRDASGLNRQPTSPNAQLLNPRPAPNNQLGSAGGERVTTSPGPSQPAPRPPFGPLSQRHQQQIETLLRYWEFSTAPIKYYQCEFKRWDWDPHFGPKQFAREFSKGVIKFEQPDKGLYQVKHTEVFRRADPQTQQPVYETLDVPGEHWVCDGANIFQYDYNNKVIKKRVLPPNVRGPQIVNGPLPFLLSAKADDIKRRFWLRLVQPPANMRNTYWLEAYPKGRQDAGNFQFVRIILDREVDDKYLPRALVIFAPGYDPVKNPSRTTYEFEQRQVNPLHINLNVFRQSFYKIKPGSGWRIDDGGATPQAPPAARSSRSTFSLPFGRR